ncbi:21205_t:CDS:2, partial [Dentiscutata erythropus]
DKKDGMRVEVWVEEWKWDREEEGVSVGEWEQRECKRKEEYAVPENPETEPRKDRENRLKNKRNAKYRYYQALEEGNAGGPSTRTRSRTSKASSDSRIKTKEGQKDRQQVHRASLSEAKKKENLEKRKKAYKKKKQEQFEQFYKIGYCREKPGLCCMNGQVVLAPLQAPPPEILYFLTEKDPISK